MKTWSKRPTEAPETPPRDGAHSRRITPPPAV